MKKPITKKFVFIALLFLLVFVAIEASSWIGLVLLKQTRGVTYAPQISLLPDEPREILQRFVQQGNTGHFGQDPDLGWSVLPDGVSDNERYRANSSGIRSDRDFSNQLPDHTIRITTFGDSFTHGSDVGVDDTWQEQLMRLSEGFEILNFGVGAYGLDQAFLRYQRDGATFKSHLVCIGFMSENIYRNVNVLRLFYRSGSLLPFTKPRFVVEDRRLKLLPNPLRTREDYKNLLENDRRILAELGATDYHYQMRYTKGRIDFLPSVRMTKILLARLKLFRNQQESVVRDGYYNVDSKAFAITHMLFDAFYQTAIENGSVPIVVIYPDSSDQHRYRKHKNKRYAPLIEAFEKQGIRFIDLMDALTEYEQQYEVDDLVVEWGHFSPIAHEIAARYILNYLTENDLYETSGIQQCLREDQKRLPENRLGFLR